MAVKPVPEGYHAVTPYLICKGASEAIEYYKKVFGATEIMRHGEPGGPVGHAELKIGDSVIMLADEHPEVGAFAPKPGGGTPISLMVYLPDVDTVFRRAVEAGGKEVRPLADQFYGDRSGQLLDPYGHQWTIATHTEDIEPEAMERRAAEAMKTATAG